MMWLITDLRQRSTFNHLKEKALYVRQSTKILVQVFVSSPSSKSTFLATSTMAGVKGDLLCMCVPSEPMYTSA